uniref:Uncharacterized protein n=1 Tax=Klebsiella pneumoniae TaxID=573 RepID=A0A2P1BNR1_KLEPN|nr:hypothetical protein [Klebsiella pneumoniae]
MSHWIPGPVGGHKCVNLPVRHRLYDIMLTGIRTNTPTNTMTSPYAFSSMNTPVCFAD